MNGVSKKLCVTAVSISAVVNMAQGCKDPWPYAVIIGVICIVSVVAQVWFDYVAGRKSKGETDAS